MPHHLLRRHILASFATLLAALPSWAGISVTTSDPSGGVAGSINPEPPPCAAVSLSQAAWDGPFFFGLGCNIFSAGGTGDFGLARAFTMPADAAFAVHCVNVAVATNTSPFTLDVNLWLGSPGDTMGERTLLATRTVAIAPINFANGQVSVGFADGPSLPVIPSGQTALVEVHVPTRAIAAGGPGGKTTIGANDNPATGPTYFRTNTCGVPDFVDIDPVVDDAQVVMRVDGEWVEDAFVYGTGFELPQFVEGFLDGQGGWSGDGLVVQGEASSGSQALRVEGIYSPQDAKRALAIPTSGRRCTLEFDLMRQSTSTTEAGVSLLGSSGLIAGISSFGTALLLHAHSGSAALPSIVDGAWSHCTLVLDFAAMSMSASVDGAPPATLPIVGPPTEIGAISVYTLQGGKVMNLLVDDLVLTSEPAPPPQPGDLNDDGIVDAADLGLLLANWGRTGLGDLDGDGVVNGTDLGLLLAGWS